jgi:twinkle protein
MNKFVDWNTLEFRKNSGQEKLRCPSCDETRTDKRDKSLLVNHNDGYGKCFYCEALTFKKQDKKDFSVKHYELPSQDWKNYTELSDKLIKWFEGERKIQQFALKDLGVSEENHYQPALKKEVNNIVFNYFEGETLVNKKYRSGNKAFTQSAGTKSIFYNINSVIGQSEVYIVEGEMDVLALYSFGVKNVISVPNGANDNDDYWKNSEKYLKDIEKFVIAVDNDEKGNVLKEKVAQRLGRYRCEFIEWQNKDANGDLIEGVIEESLNNRKTFPVSGTFKVEDLYDGIMDLYENGLPDTIYPKHKSFGGLKNIFSVMNGHLCVITGIPSHGKSNFSEWYGLNLVKDYNMKASFFSPEHSPMSLHQTNFIQKAIGKNFWKDMDGLGRITREDIERYKEWANEKLYLTAPEKGETATWDWLLEKFKEQMMRFGINIFFIDAFNKVELPQGNKIDEINRVLTKVTNFCQANNVIVFLVAHPTKMKKNEAGVYDCPTLYDVSGSADFRNQTHDGFGIYRYFENEETGTEGYTEFVNLKTKLGFQGEIGKRVQFEYHLPTGRYYAKGTPPPLFDMTKDLEDEEKIDTLAQARQDDWLELNDDVPF